MCSFKAENVGLFCVGWMVAQCELLSERTISSAKIKKMNQMFLSGAREKRLVGGNKAGDHIGKEGRNKTEELKKQKKKTTTKPYDSMRDMGMVSSQRCLCTALAGYEIC